MMTHKVHPEASWAPGGEGTSGSGARIRSGLTLLELVVVLAIVGLFVIVMIPVAVSAREQAERTACAGNLRQVGVGVAMYAVQNDMALPTHYQGTGVPFDTFAMRKPGGAPVNLGLLAKYVTDPKALYCPTQDKNRSPAIAFDSVLNRSTLAKAKIRTVNSSYAARARGPAGRTLPRWTIANYNNKVIYSDFTGVNEWQGDSGRLRGMIRAPHNSKGCNRLFGEGSVVWLGMRVVERHRPVAFRAPSETELDEYYRLFDVVPK